MPQSAIYDVTFQLTNGDKAVCAMRVPSDMTVVQVAATHPALGSYPVIDIDKWAATCSECGVILDDRGTCPACSDRLTRYHATKSVTDP